jgi:hypothetical protein
MVNQALPNQSALEIFGYVYLLSPVLNLSLVKVKAHVCPKDGQKWAEMLTLPLPTVCLCSSLYFA